MIPKNPGSIIPAFITNESACINDSHYSDYSPIVFPLYSHIYGMFHGNTIVLLLYKNQYITIFIPISIILTLASKKYFTMKITLILHCHKYFLIIYIYITLHNHDIPMNQGRLSKNHDIPLVELNHIYIYIYLYICIYIT